MFLAHAAAIRSADLSRQVGAAIMTDEGDLIALGCNEVPKAHGGLYWSDDHGLDGRDFQKGVDPSAAAKEEILAEILSVLNKNKVISTEYQDKIEQLLGDLLGDKFGASLRGNSDYKSSGVRQNSARGDGRINRRSPARHLGEGRNIILHNVSLSYVRSAHYCCWAKGGGFL